MPAPHLNAESTNRSRNRDNDCEDAAATQKNTVRMTTEANTTSTLPARMCKCSIDKAG